MTVRMTKHFFAFQQNRILYYNLKSSYAQNESKWGVLRGTPYPAMWVIVSCVPEYVLYMHKVGKLAMYLLHSRSSQL